LAGGWAYPLLAKLDDTTEVHGGFLPLSAADIGAGALVVRHTVRTGINCCFEVVDTGAGLVGDEGQAGASPSAMEANISKHCMTYSQAISVTSSR
jgi:hypothetical protein